MDPFSEYFQKLGMPKTDRKKELLDPLRAEYNRWEELLAGLSEAQIVDRSLPSGLSIKDVIAHLWAWQQISIARMEAALHYKDPVLPRFYGTDDPDAEENRERINAWIHQTCLDKPWPQVHDDWRAGFIYFLKLGEQIPDKDLFDPGKYAWLGGLPLSVVLTGSYEHHHLEHLEPLLDSLRLI